MSLSPIWHDRELSPKIRHACAVARKNGYRYIWIDSCCIDKSSSSELSEAINSMYKWYALADVCYAYLADVPPGDDHHAEESRFRESRWFTRGWTLQELIAPVNVVFFSQDWAPIGSKHALGDLVEDVTSINHRALLHLEPLDRFSVAQRLSWAARRKTTREEDRAYSLLGIFDISMPTLYGEGNRAFRRLQEQIMQRTPDQSLFAWGGVYLRDSEQLPGNPTCSPGSKHSITALEAMPRFLPVASPSARSPNDFQWDSGSISHVQLPASLHYEIEYTPTPYGIRTQFQVIPLTHDLLSEILQGRKINLKFPEDSSPSRCYLAVLGCEHTERRGSLLGRVCYIVPPSESGHGVGSVYTGHVVLESNQEFLALADLFPVSPETIERFHRHLQLKTVYIPHPEPPNPLESLRDKPYTAIKLVLLTETCDALRSQGYSATLRDPDPAPLDPDSYPTKAHRLTLVSSKDASHTITVEFQPTLEDGGGRFTITARVEMSESGYGHGVQLDSGSPPDSDQADRRCDTVSWQDRRGQHGGWKDSLERREVNLSKGTAGGGTRTLTVSLGLDFAGTGVYFVRVDVRSDNASSASSGPEVESAPVVASGVESVGEGGEVAVAF